MPNEINVVKLTEKQRAMRLRLCVVFSVIIVSFCLWSVLTLSLQILNGFRAVKWPTAPGGIVLSDYTLVDKSSFWVTPWVSYERQVRYQYNVQGVNYVGQRIRFIDDPLTLDEFHEQRRAYAQGNNVQVYYNPRDPGTSVLVSGLRTGTTLGLVLFVLGFNALLLYGLKLIRKDYDNVKNAKCENGLYTVTQLFQNSPNNTN